MKDLLFSFNDELKLLFENLSNGEFKFLFKEIINETPFAMKLQIFKENFGILQRFVDVNFNLFFLNLFQYFVICF